MVHLAFSKTKNVEEFPKVFQVFDSLCARLCFCLFPFPVIFWQGREESVDCRSEGCFYVIFAFINMNLFPFFLFVFPFPNGNDVIDVFYHEYNITASILQ